MARSEKFGSELGLIHEVLIMGRKVGADREFWKFLSQDEGQFLRMVERVRSESHKSPKGVTIIPVEFARNYEQTLVQARDAMSLCGCVEQEINDENFPPEHRDGVREFVIVRFNLGIYDDPDPGKSELLRELDLLGLEPEGPMELCCLGADPRLQDLWRKFPIVARRQTWQYSQGYVKYPDLSGRIVVPTLDEHGRGWDLCLIGVHSGWDGDVSFLCSRI